jgi:Mor family transcriptional regulator
MQITLELPDAVVSLLGPSPERAIYQLIKAHLAPPPAAAKPGRPIANTERDENILNEVLAGATHASIANRYGLSTIRISQIVSRSKSERPAKNKHEVRDQAIADRAVDGITHAVIANEYALSMARVNQIVAQGKAAAYIRKADKVKSDIQAIFARPQL